MMRKNGLPPVLVGNKYGRLTVISVGPPRYVSTCNRSTWNVQCDCGVEFNILAQQLKGGIASSCGCYQREQIGSRRRTHGQWDSRTYRSWHALTQRCLNPNAPGYEIYGGRGIKVCDKWKTFSGFYEDMGDRPENTSIDRIDSNGNYEAANCRWATIKEQNANTSRVTLVDFEGNMVPFQWALVALGIPEPTARYRMKHSNYTHQQIIDINFLL